MHTPGCVVYRRKHCCFFYPTVEAIASKIISAALAIPIKLVKLILKKYFVGISKVLDI
ncbi:hypothetical protein [Nostoc sp. CHAB 5715]|uniref:hypothetical protein n=1 Tax=Nostoc sp. CHAB 5715 TaxID=2780400 RepID=UPI001E46575A|nr:hypothetical protein [Nostoc sp. CHAB 5715]MCC5624340.1 hypothetical protein [Nostoc sp. CHAB 5715]